MITIFDFLFKSMCNWTNKRMTLMMSFFVCFVFSKIQKWIKVIEKMKTFNSGYALLKFWGVSNFCLQAVFQTRPPWLLIQTRTKFELISYNRSTAQAYGWAKYNFLSIEILEHKLHWKSHTRNNLHTVCEIQDIKYLFQLPFLNRFFF